MHVTISDFMLNLDPTADDAWTLTDANWRHHIRAVLTLLLLLMTVPYFSFGNDDTGNV